MSATLGEQGNEHIPREPSSSFVMIRIIVVVDEDTKPVGDTC